jgi:membrane protein required for colicin V production
VLLSWIGHPTISAVVGFLAVFFLVAILLIIVGNTISKLIHFAKMGCLDRLLGGILGIFKGVLICGIACMVILTFTPRGAHVLRDSVLAPRVLSFTNMFFSLFPRDVKERLERRLKSLQQSREAAISGGALAADQVVASGRGCGVLPDGSPLGILWELVEVSCPSAGAR